MSENCFVGDICIVTTGHSKKIPGADHEYAGGYRDGIVSILSALKRGVHKSQLNRAWDVAINRFEEDHGRAMKTKEKQE